MDVLCLGTHSGFARQPHRECRIRCRSEFGTRPCLERATERRSQCAIERVTERAIRGRARPGADSGAEAPSLCGIDCGADGGIGRRVDAGAGRRTEERAKSLTGSHIDGQVDGRVDCRVVPGVEPRSHPRIDPPPADAGFSQDSGPSSRTLPQNQGRVFARPLAVYCLLSTIRSPHLDGLGAEAARGGQDVHARRNRPATAVAAVPDPTGGAHGDLSLPD